MIELVFGCLRIFHYWFYISVARMSSILLDRTQSGAVLIEININGGSFLNGANFNKSISFIRTDLNTVAIITYSVSIWTNYATFHIWLVIIILGLSLVSIPIKNFMSFVFNLRKLLRCFVKKILILCTSTL